jgi:hypothetical protein
MQAYEKRQHYLGPPHPEPTSRTTEPERNEPTELFTEAQGPGDTY